MAMSFSSASNGDGRRRPLPGALVPVFALVAVTGNLLLVAPAAAAETYVRATIDQDGQLRILTADGRNIEAKREGEQIGFANPQISPDGSAVGWLAEYPNCCTSYAIPLKLVILTNDGVRTFTGTGLPVWRWKFQAGGAHVAFRQETVHSGRNVHCELREVASGRLLAEYDPPVGPDNQPLAAAQDVPRWVAELDR